MDEVTDMDDLLDEMESDLMRKSRTDQPPPPLLPLTSIAMQPRSAQKKPPTRHIVSVPKYTISEDINTETEGHININSSLLPNTFQPKPKCVSPIDGKDIKKENILPESTNGVHEKELVSVQHKELQKEDVSKNYENNETKTLIQDRTCEQFDSKTVPFEISEPEEDTPVPETQIISNLHVTDREEIVRDHNKKSEDESVVLDTEMESMLDYLNGVDEENATIEGTSQSIPENKENVTRKAGGRDSIDEDDGSVFQEFADKLSQEVISAALTNQISEHVDQEIHSPSWDSTSVGFTMSLDTHIVTNNSDANTSNYLSEPENSNDKQQEEIERNKGSCDKIILSGDESNLDETEKKSSSDQKEEIQGIVSEIIEIVQDISFESSDKAEKGSEDNSNLESSKIQPIIDDLGQKESVTTEIADSNDASEEVPNDSVGAPSTDSQEQPDDVPIEVEKYSDNSKQEKQKISQCEETPINAEIIDPGTADNEEESDIVEDAIIENQELTMEENNENAENRPRFDSSIATIHVLHESDSDESLPTRRERRLTESELQLGKTSPYWIPDSECPLCMLCNSKFTIITRRHHCRACGRVLCGSCCNEKAVLEYLHEEGKKPQAVRVCKTCSSMLSRIEAHEQEEQRRRESVVSDGQPNDNEQSGSLSQPPVSVPRGVLKTRSMTQSNDEESSSTSNQIPSTSASVSDSSRRSVMFRDGVRPGATSVNDENPEEERSTALKPKKKSRKRTSVVRRIAELRMEDELACALPKNGSTNVLILKPDSDRPKFEFAHNIFESLCNFSVVTVVLKKNLNCTVQIFNNPNFGLVWAVSTQGFSQIGLDELFFSWTLSDTEKQKIDSEEPEIDDKTALSFLPLSVFQRISTIYVNSTEHEYAGVRRVDNRLMRVHTVSDPQYPLTKHIMFYRPTIQTGLENMRIPMNPFVIACFLNDDELNWATALPNRLLYKLGEKCNVFPTPFVNNVGRPSLYSTDVSGTVLKVFTDFRSWSYRMKHIPGCTVSLTNDKTTIRIPRSCLKELKDILNFSRSMVAWSCDFHQDDDSILICEESDPGLYSTQVFAKNIGQRESTSASFVILDGGSKVNSLQVNVVEDGVAIRLQTDRLETILSAINEGHDVVESSKDMEFRVEFVEDGDWISPESDYYPKSQIDGLCLINKFQYGLSLERALTQVLQVQGLSDFGVRLSHVFNLGDGRLQPEEEPKIYGMVEIAARECVAMLEPHIQSLIHAGIGSVSIRLFVSPYEMEYDVSRWIGLEKENDTYRQSLDQLIPMLCNIIEHIPNGFEVEFVLSIVSTKALPV